jgi:hypothetical protein
MQYVIAGVVVLITIIIGLMALKDLKETLPVKDCSYGWDENGECLYPV